MRWAYVRPRCRSEFYDPEVHEPLGLEALAADRRTRGDDVLLLDATLDDSSDARLGRRAAAFRPDVIGFSLTTAQELGSATAIHAECARVLDTPVRWVAGGNFVSSEPHHARRLLPPELTLIRFEGERALAAWSKQEAPPGAPQAEGSTIDGEPVLDLDSLSFPLRPYADLLRANEWAFNIQGSRGCCGVCRYCAAPSMSGRRRTTAPPPGPPWRGRSPDHVAEEVKMLHERHGTRWFNFVDEDLLGPPRSSHERAVGLASALDRRGVKVSFGAQLRPATARPETIDTLVEAGLSYVFIGVESDEPADLRRWARREVPGVWSAIERLQTAGVDVGVGTLLFHPDATLDGIERFARRLASHQLLDYRTATNRLDAIPGSAYHRDAVGMGVINPSVVGPQRLPIASPEVEPFHRDLLYVLSPLGPPAMHALCALPPWSARRRLAGDPPAEYTALKSILATTRETVVRAFFALLEAHRRGEARAIGGELRRTCAAAGVDAARALARGGFARSAEQLLEAMRIDAQLEEGEAC